MGTWDQEKLLAKPFKSKLKPNLLKPPKSLKEKEVWIPDEEVNYLFKGLRELNLIELPDSKRPHEADRVGDPLYCPYHRVFGQSKIALSWSAKSKINEGTVDVEVVKTIKKGKKVAASNTATYSCLTIDVFDEDDGPLHFPGEPIYVNKITLRSGTQLPDVQPPAPSVGVYQAPPNQTASPDRIKYNVMAHLKIL